MDVSPPAGPDRTVEFFQLVTDAPCPVPADGTTGGTIPIRAFKYCEPVRMASSIGWYVFPPIDFSVLWDGVLIRWRCAGLPDWLPLETAQYPKFASFFDETCPEDVRGFAPPFLASVVEPGMFQCWSGLIAKTQTGWSLNIRPPINLPPHRHARSMEGIIETDRWFGPLMTNFQIEQTNVEVHFPKDRPLFMVHLVRTCDVQKDNNRKHRFKRIDEMTQSDWNAYRETIVKRVSGPRVPGAYAVESRKLKSTTGV